MDKSLVFFYFSCNVHTCSQWRTVIFCKRKEDGCNYWLLNLILSFTLQADSRDQSLYRQVYDAVIVRNGKKRIHFSYEVNSIENMRERERERARNKSFQVFYRYKFSLSRLHTHQVIHEGFEKKFD